MTKSIVLILLLTVVTGWKVTAQTTADPIVELNRDVWHPFVKALNETDIDGYLAVHHPDVLRVSLDRGGLVHGGDHYRNTLQTLFGKIKTSGSTQHIEFRFTERMVADKVASERGFYKFTYTTGNANNAPYQATVIFGSFHVISQKDENGRWKIRMDFDYTSQERQYNVTEQLFLTGTPL
jgi:ketosteroid isomerase-like protein